MNFLAIIFIAVYVLLQTYFFFVSFDLIFSKYLRNDGKTYYKHNGAKNETAIMTVTSCLILLVSMYFKLEKYSKIAIMLSSCLTTVICVFDYFTFIEDVEKVVCLGTFLVILLYCFNSERWKTLAN
jgi:predicted MPP superfamily phosphohydrolase